MFIKLIINMKFTKVLLSLFAIGVIVWITSKFVASAPMLGYGRLSVREYSVISWAFNNYKARWNMWIGYVTCSSLWLGSCTDNATVKAAFLSKYWNCFLRDYEAFYSVSDMDNAVSLVWKVWPVCPWDWTWVASGWTLSWWWSSGIWKIVDNARRWYDNSMSTSCSTYRASTFYQPDTDGINYISGWNGWYRIDEDWAWVWSGYITYCDMTNNTWYNANVHFWLTKFNTIITTWNRTPLHPLFACPALTWWKVYYNNGTGYNGAAYVGSGIYKQPSYNSTPTAGTCEWKCWAWYDYIRETDSCWKKFVENSIAIWWDGRAVWMRRYKCPTNMYLTKVKLNQVNLSSRNRNRYYGVSVEAYSWDTRRWNVANSIVNAHSYYRSYNRYDPQEYNNFDKTVNGAAVHWWTWWNNNYNGSWRRSIIGTDYMSSASPWSVYFRAYDNAYGHRTATSCRSYCYRWRNIEVSCSLK